MDLNWISKTTNYKEVEQQSIKKRVTVLVRQYDFNSDFQNIVPNHRYSTFPTRKTFKDGYNIYMKQWDCLKLLFQK